MEFRVSCLCSAQHYLSWRHFRFIVFECAIAGLCSPEAVRSQLFGQECFLTEHFSAESPLVIKSNGNLKHRLEIASQKQPLQRVKAVLLGYSSVHFTWFFASGLVVGFMVEARSSRARGSPGPRLQSPVLGYWLCQNVLFQKLRGVWSV